MQRMLISNSHNKYNVDNKLNYPLFHCNVTLWNLYSSPHNTLEKEYKYNRERRKNSLTNTNILTYKDGKLSHFVGRERKKKIYIIKYKHTYIETGQNYCYPFSTGSSGLTFNIGELPGSLASIGKLANIIINKKQFFIMPKFATTGLPGRISSQHFS